MKPYDLYESTEGVHLRILVYAEPYSYVVDCDHFRMPMNTSQPAWFHSG